MKLLESRKDYCECFLNREKAEEKASFVALLCLAYMQLLWVLLSDYFPMTSM